LLKDAQSVEQAKDNDLLIVRVSQGEDINDYEFSRDEVNALNKNKIRSIQGTYRRGYWWADGDHTEALTVIKCSR